MSQNFLALWYSDSADIYRTSNFIIGNIDKKTRQLIQSNIPCRIFRSSKPATKMTTTASEYTPFDSLACETSVDIRAGDEIIVSRGINLGYADTNPSRYFAGDPTDYYEPFGGVMPDLAHKEVPLSGGTKVGE